MSIENNKEITSELFRKHWGMYQKILRDNYMGHGEAYGTLNIVLNTEMDRRFSFADLACGDAYYTSRALDGTSVSEYTGIDLSEDALTLAEKTMKHQPFSARFIRADFVEFSEHIDPPLDVAWVGLSLHHLDKQGKLNFMTRLKSHLHEDGIFLTYEPVLINGEDRAAYFERFKAISDEVWVDLTDEERQMLLDHVRETERPETKEDWLTIGRQAGFKTAEILFTERTGLYTLFKFK